MTLIRCSLRANAASSSSCIASSSSSGSASLGSRRCKSSVAARAARAKPPTPFLGPQQKEQRTQKLRRAIDLYHLSPAFYPSYDASATAKPWSPAVPNVGAEKVAPLDQRIVQDVLSPVYMKQQTGGQHSTTFFATPATLLSQAERRSLEARSLGTSGGGGVRNSSDSDAGNALFSGTAFESTPSAFDPSVKIAYNPYATKAISDAKVDAATLRHVRQLAKQLSEQRSVGATSQRGTADAKAFDVGSLNEREGRVRDALFGTVRGTLPGLETLRDRIEKRNKEQKAGLRE